MLRVRLAKQRGELHLDVEFEMRTAGLVALFGRSGCGKTTTVDLLAGLLHPDSGHVELDGETLYDGDLGIDVPAERRHIGYVFQDSRLFPHLSVLGNLRYGEKRAAQPSRPGAAEEIVALLGLAGLLGRHPYQLSGGERQRVALGRALLSQPRLLLLDEPLASLDQARREELLPYLERLRDRLAIPIIYVSHQFEEVLRLATHVVLLEAGVVVAQGDVADVCRHPALRGIVGSDAIGTLVEGRIEWLDATTQLAEISVGRGRLRVEADGLERGQNVRARLLARDLILAIEPPRGLSVRNALEGTLVSMTPDEPRARLLEVDIGGPRIIARVTEAACLELALQPGRQVWVLVKAVSLRGRVYPGVSPREPPHE